ncbi:MAG: tRNA uridine-5-carboxymethylaminomethyl(34) synthesis GTPase MnmE [Clostridiales bacterium]|nr:tRNA uridine-5-carboxymethylaminomethyl(34) synthesis GTPase MnmE [Clostridiales bacterium]
MIKYMTSDDIVGVATPPGRGGVSIVRISGSRSHRILQNIFVSDKPLSFRELTFGKVKTEHFEDSVLAVIFCAPHSYTGENIAEIHCHGSPIVVECILQSILNQGCKMAQRGEFTRRAVLNGKMDLIQAEGIIDRIDADSTQQIVQSGYLLDGALSQQVNDLQSVLLDCLARCEVALDYPEENLDFDIKNQLQLKLTGIAAVIDAMLDGYRRGRLIKEGVRVVLAGSPNVGKSSMLNALLGYDRAIVNEKPGTTTDVIRESYQYNGVKFILSDMAGLRQAKANIEKQGVQRSFVEIESADVIVCFDHHFADDSRSILITNKADLQQTTVSKFRLGVSAKYGLNIDNLKQLVYNKSIGQNRQSAVLNNMRHFDALKSAKHSVHLALDALHITTLECVSIDIKAAWVAVKSLTGLALTEQILDEIFSRFCVGK